MGTVPPGPQPNSEKKPEPMTPLYCEMCGTTITPQWRKGPFAKSFCNSCGVKWKLNRYIGDRRTTFNSNELLESSDSSESIQGGNQELKAHAKSLKKIVKTAEKEANRMSQILNESHLEDRDVDQELRQILLHSTGQKQNFIDQSEDATIQRFLSAIKRHRQNALDARIKRK